VTVGWLEQWLADHGDELTALRRHLHAHPELGQEETATTELLANRLSAAGLQPRRLPAGTGLICEVGTGEPIVGLRADLDALPIDDTKSVAYASSVPGVCHACGHDVHTTVLLGAALALATRRTELRGTVRLIFQPAEELIPGGALDVIEAGGVDGLQSLVALHCAPALDVGAVGLRVGPITSAADWVEVRIDGPGGHTARPQLTVNLVEVLGRLAVEVPERITAKLDGAPFQVVWGNVQAGGAGNVIPSVGYLRGSVRTSDTLLWDRGSELLAEAVDAVIATTGARATIDYRRGVPPVVNDEHVVDLLRAGVESAVGPEAATTTEVSMGGEDFGWYQQLVPSAMARLGVRTPGQPTRDLHRGDFDVDESSIGVGVRVLVGTALQALG
jgi:amidohydrolase